MLQTHSIPDSSPSAAAAGDLLATKLYIPALRANLVSRRRLLERLDAGLAAHLILVSAPAGAGKTTLLSEWLGQCPCRTAWVSLEAADSDPERFFGYVLAAVEGAVPGSGRAVQAQLGQAAATSLEPLLTQWLNGLCGLDGPLALVLDDYHTIEAEAVHRALAFVIANLPPQVHLVMATRADPPLPLARLRARGHLLELRGDDLRFTSEEAAEFLRRVMGLELSAGDVAALEERTEGWIAGLQMAALSMQGREDVAAFVQAFSGSHRYVLDYLTEEVLERQPEEVQAFLLQTSVLERLTAPLCEALTGQGGAQAMLEGLERRNLFLVPLDDGRQWYRYHQLFRSLLRDRLREAQPALEHSLWLRAADWCEGNGLLADATDYAAQAEDFERAARLAEERADAMYLAGHCSQLQAQVDRLPLDPAAHCPRLCAYMALRLVAMSNVVEAEELLQRIEETAKSRAPGPEASDLLGMVTAVRASIANLEGDMPRLDRLARQARAQLSEENPLRAHVAFALADMAYQDGDLEGADREFLEARRVGQDLGSAAIVASATRALVSVQEARGWLNAALALAREVLDCAQRRPELRYEAIIVNVRAGYILCERGDLEAAERHLLAAIDALEPGRADAPTAFAHTALAHLRLAQGDLAAAAKALGLAERLIAERPVTSDIAAKCTACRVRLLLAQGRLPGGSDALAAAGRWADERRPQRGEGLAWAEELEQTMVARVRLAQGRSGEAVDLLAGLAEAAEAGGRGGRLIEVLALQALALHAQGRSPEALAALARSLTLAEPGGYVRLFVDEGPAMAEMLRELREVEELSELRGYIERLLTASAQPFPSVPSIPSVPAAPSLEPLSARELEVLKLAAAGLSNREIAERLIVTVGTVKTHMHNIYGKLGARGRAHALARAREAGLL